MLRSVKIPIVPENPQKTREFLGLCGKLYNEYTTWAKENTTWNKNKAHKELYSKLREQYPTLPSALIQTVRDNALESCKQCKLKSLPRKKTLSVRFDKRTFRLKDTKLWLSTEEGRKAFSLVIPPYAEKYFVGELKQVMLLCSRKGKFSVVLTFNLPTPEKVKQGEVLGIDRGIYHIAVTSDNQFFSSSKVRSVKRKYLYTRKVLQKKGTSSAKKKLKAISGKEERFIRDTNHCISKKIVSLPATTFVLERLEGITKNRRKHPAKKRLNKRLSGWSFRQLAEFLSYKAESLGKIVTYVSAVYTSQKCSNCKQRHDTHRNKSHFRCAGCGLHLHADLNAALNIKDDYLISLPLKKTEEQGAVNHPYVSELTQAKACGIL
jgi:putative transposase